MLNTVTMSSWITTLSRLIDGALDAINKYKASKAIDNPAGTIAGDGGVLKSNKSFEDIVSNKPESDRAKRRGHLPG